MYSNLQVPQIIAEGMKISMDTNHTYFFGCYYLLYSDCYVYTYKRIHLQLTSNTLWNSTTPVSISLAFSEPGTLQMVSRVADIDSKGPRDDSSVAHNTTWELSTVLQSNTSLIRSCDRNAKVCKCTTCKIISNCTTSYNLMPLYSLNFILLMKDLNMWPTCRLNSP